jgi:hypothetical protein
MALIVEDGTGVENANGLVTVEFCTSYFADRGMTAWGSDTTAQEQAIIKATDYMELRYQDKWKGFLSADATTLSWPRDYLVDRKGVSVAGTVPLDIQKACAEYAIRALTATLAPDPASYEDGKFVTHTYEKVGPIENEVYFSSNFQDLVKKFPVPDGLVKPWLNGGGGVYR